MKRIGGMPLYSSFTFILSLCSLNDHEESAMGQAVGGGSLLSALRFACIVPPRASGRPGGKPS